MSGVLETILASEGERRAIVFALVVDGEGTGALAGAKVAVTTDAIHGTTGDVDLDRLILTEGQRALAEHDRPALRRLGQWRVYLEVIQPVQRLVIVGAGHVGIELCRMASQVGFEVTVLDARPGAATRERLPEAWQVRCGNLGEGLTELDLDECTCVALVGHDHRQDVECLVALSGRPAAYLGMIGSRRRVKAVREAALEEGVSEEFLDAVHAPIGLDIGAVSPAEIALSILAEVIGDLRGASQGRLGIGYGRR